MSTISGTCEFYFETGMEGARFAFHDESHVGYAGLHILKNGDQLTIYDTFDSSKIVWEGVIKLIEYPPYTESVFGCWIHSDQIGINREVWARWFIQEYPASLILGIEE